MLFTKKLSLFCALSLIAGTIAPTAASDLQKVEVYTPKDKPEKNSLLFLPGVIEGVVQGTVANLAADYATSSAQDEPSPFLLYGARLTYLLILNKAFTPLLYKLYETIKGKRVTLNKNPNFKQGSMFAQGAMIFCTPKTKIVKKTTDWICKRYEAGTEWTTHLCEAGNNMIKSTLELGENIVKPFSTLWGHTKRLFGFHKKTKHLKPEHL